MAAWKGHADCVRLLIDAGANMEAKDRQMQVRAVVSVVHRSFHEHTYLLHISKYLIYSFLFHSLLFHYILLQYLLLSSLCIPKRH